MKNKDYSILECNGNCLLSITGYMNTWDTVCNKCKGTKEDVSLIENAFHDGTIESKEIIKAKYDFDNEELNLLNGYWF